MFIATYLPHADEQTKTLFKTTLATMKQLNHRIDEMKPKELFADSVAASDGCILIGELAKLICQNGYEIGQKRLFKWMREHHFLISRKGTDYNTPTQKAVEAGLLVTKERTVSNPDGSVMITRTTMVTGKGQVYFINKFLS